MPLTDDPAAAEIAALLQQELSTRFDVLRMLGRGGMGTVYLARELSLDRLVAIKVRVRNAGESPAVLDRFRREARLAASLQHPAIVRVYAVGDSADLVWFAMEYVEGPSLEQYVREGGAIETPRAIQLLRELSGALAYAHAQGIVHRDVKPSNVLVALDGRFLLADFGIAKQDKEEALTTTGRIIGTPSYMSPEQFRGQPLTSSSDQYALGGVLYFACTGREPFDASDIAVLIRSHLLDAAPSIQSVNPKVPAVLDGIVQRMLAKTAEERFPNLSDVLPALQRIEFNANDSGTQSSGRRYRHRLIAVGLVALCMLTVFWWNARTRDVPANGERTVDEVPATSTPTAGRIEPQRPDIRPNAPTQQVRRAQNTSSGDDPTRGNATVGGLSPANSKVEGTSSQIGLTAPQDTPAVLRLGSRISGAVLHINGDAIRVLGTPEFQSIPAGTLRLSVRADQCRSWDTTVTVPPGDTLSFGYRNPICR